VGQEIDLMIDYPRTKRNVEERGSTKTPEDRAIARQFGKDFFDGSRDVGYGGFNYMPRFWEPVVPTFQKHWDLKAGDSVLDVGCAKGFMMYDMQRLIPGLQVRGIDISQYAIENAKEEVREFCSVASCDELPFEDKSFDVVISITTVHNMDYEGCIRTLKEIERVSRRGSFITVDAYHNDEEKKRMEAWNLTAQTVLHVDEWREMFDKAGYTGDYYWFIP
jgi:SAM-dependent methyltransferase